MGYRSAVITRCVNPIQHDPNPVNTPEGTTHVDKATTQTPGTWQEVTVGINVPSPRDINPRDEWAHCSYVIAESGDKCTPESWVFFRSSNYSSLMADEVCVQLAKYLMINQITGICGKDCSDPPATAYQPHCPSSIGHIGTISYCTRT